MRRYFVLAALAIAVLGTSGGCSDSPTSFSDDAILLPATLSEALQLADQIAGEWSENAQLARIGGGFTVMNAEGRARNHTFVYFARDGRIRRKLDLHLISGVPWQFDQIVSEPDPPLDLTGLSGSDVVIPAAINFAELVNEAFPDSIPIPENFSARLSSRPVWPEPGGTDDPTNVAWRVDFLVSQVNPASGAIVWYSSARFYYRPESQELELLGTAIPNQPELYPFPTL